MKQAERAEALSLIQEAHRAMRRGDRLGARRLAERAATLAPDREEPWLLLAALASPRASVAYLDKALERNPRSAIARQGMHWAAKRLRELGAPAKPPPPAPALPAVSLPDSPEAMVASRISLLPLTLALLIALAAVLYWFGGPRLASAFPQNRQSAPALASQFKPTYTPTATPTFTPTPTSTPTPTPTDTPTPVPTDTPVPSLTPTLVTGSLPPEVGAAERWIDVDLGEQRAYAYQGTSLQRSFVVSTGTWQHPTVLGTYRIYVKYRFADMAGPGYYLADVPYVMYFFRGYGLHGTYWHNNFGTPMSHGCVNFTIDDAGWLFDFASVGTIVHVHN